MRGERAKHEKVVVIKNMFNVKDHDCGGVLLGYFFLRSPDSKSNAADLSVEVMEVIWKLALLYGNQFLLKS